MKKGVNNVLETKDQDITPVVNNQPKKIGNIRWGLAGLFFIIGVIAYMDRANLAVLAVPMMKDLDMSLVQFGALSSFFFIGYSLSQIPGGMLAEKFGAHRIITMAVMMWSLFTALTAAASTFVSLCITRFLFGVGEGPLFTSNAVFNSYWFQKNEKGRAASVIIAGSSCGNVIAPVITVALFTLFGWQAVFYCFAVIGLIIAGIWYFVGRDKPEEHPWISQEERTLILRNRSIQEVQKGVAPWKKFIKNPQFWAIGLQYFFVSYMTMLFLAWLPTYLQEARNFSLKSMGVAASFPWLANVICVFVGGAISDALLRNGKSRMVARGGVAIVGLIIFIISIYFAAKSNDPYLNVVWLTIALGALGFPTVTSWATAADLGNQFSGSVSGWMNTWGASGGALSPIICGWIAQNFGWDVAIMTSIVPITLAIVAWFFIKPDRPLIKN